MECGSLIKQLIVFDVGDFEKSSSCHNVLIFHLQLWLVWYFNDTHVHLLGLLQLISPSLSHCKLSVVGMNNNDALFRERK